MKTVLLVEDDPMISEIYQKKLSASGFEVDLAFSGPEALRKAQEKEFDVILLDLVLPEMNGFEILEKLRSDPAYNPNARVIVLSNLNDEESRDRVVKLGAIGYLEKALYNPSEIVVEIQRMLYEEDERERNRIRRDSPDKSVFSLFRGKKILFFEDEEIFVELFVQKLREEGFVVDVAENEEEGVRMAQQEIYDMAVVDAAGDKLNGRQIIQNIQREKSAEELPVIALINLAEDEDIFRADNLDVQGFLLRTQTVPSGLVREVESLFAEREARISVDLQGGR